MRLFELIGKCAMIVGVMDKLTVFNQALSYLGDREYVRNTPSGEACDLWWPTVLREALIHAAWSWSKKVVKYERINDGRYVLPPDCMRVLKVSVDKFRIEGNVLIVEIWGRKAHRVDGLELEYQSDDVARMEVIPDNAPMFCKGVVLLLASKCAMKLGAGAQNAVSLEQQAMFYFRKAAYLDAVQFASNDQDPLVDILNSSIF